MVERREELGLSLETGESFGIPGDVVRQDFDRHIPAELSASRPINLPHAAFSNGLEDFVVGEFVAGCE